MTGAAVDGQRCFHGFRRDVAQIDEHPEPVHLMHDRAAERGEAVMAGLSVAELAQAVLEVWVSVI